MFQQSNVVIRDGNFWHTEFVFETAFEKLQKASAPSAFHDSNTRFDPPKCHPNTRIAILEYLMGWVFGRNDHEALILWLYGPAGAGKSTILQTIAERCFERKVLLASFFFGRSDSTRNTFKPLIATIAYQIATTLPEIKPILENIIERDPLIFSKSIAIQLRSLIVEPLKDLTASGFFNDPRNCARLVLIDGLDECNDPRMQSMILKVFASALRDHKLPLIFLIASRPEQHISLTFNSPSLDGLWRSLVLDVLYEPDDDIRLFLTDSFEEVKLTHPHGHLIPEAWPKPSDIDNVVRKSSGQFIYASVVVKYVSDPFDRPSRRLEVIMGLRPGRHNVPFAELDALYMHIVASCTDRDTTLSIIGLIITGISSATDSIEMHLDLEPGDVEIALAPLAAIIDVNDHGFIALHHASFSDFLVDISRSGPFYINISAFKERLIPKSIHKLMDPRSITDHNQPGRKLLIMLADTFHPSLDDVPFTRAVESALEEFSILRFWSIWSTEPYSTTDGSKAYFASIFLKFLSGYRSIYNTFEDDVYPRPLGFSTIYAVHLSSFESIIRSEVPKYYQDVGLTSLVVLSILDTDTFSTQVYPLLNLTKEAEELDHNSLWLDSSYGKELLATHYRYLFTGPRKSADVCPDGEIYAEVALRFLEYLCNHPPRPIPYQKRQTPNAHSHRTGQSQLSESNRRFHSLPSRNIVRRMRLTSRNFLRKRREAKHQHGVALTQPPIQYVYSSPRRACDSGLSLLPYILKLSSPSTELVDFIRRHGKNVVFLPKRTRTAIRALHEYLRRADEDADIVELQVKFAAMAIE